MNFSAIVLYGLINVVMVIYYLCGKGHFYQFPFWAGIIALGWFMPQAIGGYLNASQFPANAYAYGLFFATLKLSCKTAVKSTRLKKPVQR